MKEDRTRGRGGEEGKRGGGGWVDGVGGGEDATGRKVEVGG